MQLAAAISLVLAPTLALADCASEEAALTAWFEARYGADSREVTEMRTGSLETRWGLAVATYISTTNPLLSVTSDDSDTLVLREDLGPYAPTADDLAAIARVLFLAEDTVTCLRPDGGPMMIGERDMGAQFDETHPEPVRAAIRAFAESLL